MFSVGDIVYFKNNENVTVQAEIGRIEGDILKVFTDYGVDEITVNEIIDTDYVDENKIIDELNEEYKNNCF